MKKSGRVAFSIAMGVGVFGMAKGIETSSPSLVEWNQPAIECAHSLGTAAVKSENLPNGCNGNDFSWTEQTVTNYNSTTGEYTDDSQIVYSLPSSTEFLKNELQTQEEYDANRRFLHKFFIGVAAVAGAVMYPLSGGLFQNKNRDVEVTSE